MPWTSKKDMDALLSEVRAARAEVSELRERVGRLQDADDLRQRLDEKQIEIERLSAQGLHVLGLLNEARARISQLEHSSADTTEA